MDSNTQGMPPEKEGAAGRRPTVSVVMATWNGARFLRPQLDSILAQTYPLHEVIIQDDGSTDATADICREYASRHPRVRFYQNARRLGLNRNFQAAARRATGDFVALSDQDDVWFPDKVARLVAAIGGHDICFSAHTRGADPAHARTVSPQYAPEALLFQGFAGHTALFRRDFIQRDSNWIPRIIYDWGLELSAQMGRGIAFVAQPLGWHRTNEASACAVMDRQHGAAARPRQAWQPYLHGWSHYRRLQRDPAWEPLYRHIRDDAPSYPPLRLMRTMAALMLSRTPLALLRLCWLCMRHRRTVYPTPPAKGMMGLVRGFCYPFIFAYNNYQYRLE